MSSPLTVHWYRRLPLFGRKRAEEAIPTNQPEAVFAAKRQVFASIARRQESVLLRVARRLCGPAQGGEDRARDLVQDTLVIAYEAFLDNQFSSIAAASTPDEVTLHRERGYLLKVLTNRFINEYRRRRKWESGMTVDEMTQGGTLAPVPGMRSAPDDEPGCALLTGTLDEPIEQALLSLSEGLRLCVVLVEIEGMEYSEAAATLNIPIGTVRSRLSRARLQLQEKLEEYARQRGLV